MPELLHDTTLRRSFMSTAPESQDNVPGLVFLVGLSGSGKTSVGSALANRLGVNFFDTDLLIEKMEEAPISNIFEEMGEPYFRNCEIQAIDRICNTEKSGIVATGGGLPAIEGMIPKLRDNGLTIYMSASLDELWNRLTVNPGELEKRPLLFRKGRAGLEEQLLSREAVYLKAAETLRTDGADIDQILEKLVEIVFDHVRQQRTYSTLHQL
jgi:shikimate kinase